MFGSLGFSLYLCSIKNKQVMEKKYILTEETKEWNGHILHRIEASKDFGSVEQGDRGGWVESENNLSHDGYCWVSCEAVVCGNSVVSDDALVCGNACVSGSSYVYGNSRVYGCAVISGNIVVRGSARVSGNARVSGDALVADNAEVYGDANVSDGAEVLGYAVVCGNAKVSGDAKVYGNAQVGGDAQVRGYAEVCGDAELCGDAVIKDDSDYLVFKNVWSSGRYFTWTKSNDKWKVGCFHGTGKELIEKAYEDGYEKGKFYQKYVEIVEMLKKC